MHKKMTLAIVCAATVALAAKDLVYKTEHGYVVYDRMFGEWLRRI